MILHKSYYKALKNGISIINIFLLNCPGPRLQLCSSGHCRDACRLWCREAAQSISIPRNLNPLKFQRLAGGNPFME